MNCDRLAKTIAAAATAAILLGAAPSPAPSPAPAPAEIDIPAAPLTILASGNRRSELEPCGCRSAQQGGIDLEANYVARARAKGARLLLVDAGGFADNYLSTPNEFLKTQYLVKAMGAIGYEIINVSQVDMVYGMDWLRRQAEENRFQLISANIAHPYTKELLFEPYAIRDARADANARANSFADAHAARFSRADGTPRGNMESGDGP